MRVFSSTTRSHPQNECIHVFWCRLMTRNLAQTAGWLPFVWLSVFEARCHAQEMDPRAYVPGPRDSTFLFLAYGRSSGGILLDPSVPYTDVNAQINIAAVGGGGTFGLFGRLASATVGVPYAWGHASGNLGGDERSGRRSGLADSVLRLGVNLIGGPALPAREFARNPPDTAVGVSLTVSAPTGQYDSSARVNLGTNRWALKPEIGITHPIGRWRLEVAAGVTVFTDNNNYLQGAQRSEEPIGNLQGHVSYTFRPRLWLALDSTYYFGGQTSVNGVPSANRQANSRVGLTLSVPVAKQTSLRFLWSDGATTRVGQDFHTFGVTWTRSWVN